MSTVAPSTDQFGHHHHHHRTSVPADGSPLTVWKSSTHSAQQWPSSTSRRNLETILEAIRHLEGEPTSLVVARRDDVVVGGQAASNSLSLAEALRASTNVPFTASKACVAVRSS